MKARAFGAVALGAGVLGVTGWAGVGASAPAPAPFPVGAASVFLFHATGETGPGFPDGAPARVTGGFGEESCVGCHWEREVNTGPGVLRLSGVPEAYEAGRSYILTVELEDPAMQVAGFQLAARFASDTTQAGGFAVPDPEEGRVGIQVDREVQFAQHLEAGTRITGDEGDAPVARWQLRWTAPDEPRGPIHFHLAAVAGDGDRSQMGDDVHALEVVVRP